NDNLTNEFNDSKTDSYIERMARERLGMIKNGEKVVVD
ncbi:MAG: FtsB family cell division protein, partial [Lactococcus garvieae]